MGYLYWTDEEKQIVFENYKENCIRELSQLLPNRTYESIRTFLNNNHLKAKKEDGWTENELNILKLNYYKPQQELQNLLPNKSWQAIRMKGSLHKLQRKAAWCWTDIEEQLLKDNYCSMSQKELKKIFSNRTWTSIKLHANSLGLTWSSDKRGEESRRSDLSILLEETPVSYYWLGFLFADGHFTKDRIKVALSIKDKEHLQKYADFIKYGDIDIVEQICCVQSAQISVIQKLKSKFSIKNNKTYVPCNIQNIIDDNLFISFVIGFIDGDGCIKKLQNRKDFQITIKLHSSWLGNLQYISERISKLSNVPHVKAKINSCGYAFVSFGNTILSKFLKTKTIELNLPILSRKWSIIDLDFVSRQELGNERKEKVLTFKKQGLRNKDISILLDFSEAAVGQIVCRLKKEGKL